MDAKRVYVKSTFSDGRKEVGCFWIKDKDQFLSSFKEAIDDLKEVKFCSEIEYNTFQLASTLNFKLTESKEGQFDFNNTGEICYQVSLSFGKN